MSWKLEIIAFIVFFIASATVFANGCMDVKAPDVNRFELDAVGAGELAVEFYEPIPESEIQKTEYIIMEEMRFDVSLVDIHQ